MSNRHIYKDEAALSKKLIAFAPSEELADRIEECAVRNRLSKSEVIRRAIAQGLSQFEDSKAK